MQRYDGLFFCRHFKCKFSHTWYMQCVVYFPECEQQTDGMERIRCSHFCYSYFVCMMLLLMVVLLFCITLSMSLLLLSHHLTSYFMYFYLHVGKLAMPSVVKPRPSTLNLTHRISFQSEISWMAHSRFTCNAPTAFLILIYLLCVCECMYAV